MHLKKISSLKTLPFLKDLKIQSYQIIYLPEHKKGLEVFSFLQKQSFLLNHRSYAEPLFNFYSNIKDNYNIFSAIKSYIFPKDRMAHSSDIYPTGVKY